MQSSSDKVFAAVFTILTVIAGAAAAQDQAIYDDVLENGWADWSWATVDFASTNPVHAGTNSVRVVDPTANWKALYLHHAGFDSSPYQSLSFWVYPTQSGNNQLLVQAMLGGARQTEVYLSFTAAQVNSWQHVVLPLASLGVANKANFDGFWIMNSTGAAMTFSVDDIALTVVPPPNPVMVTVSPQSVVRTIDDRIYGLNATIWDGQFSSAASGALLAAMNTRAIRIPGGSEADNYDWQTGRSVDKASSYQWPTNAARFAQRIEASGAQAYVTVNYGSGTPEQAAAWVAYYNGSTASGISLGVDSKGRDWKTVGYWAAIRASAPLAVDDGYNFLRISHPAPFGFKYWEIGNECYGGWEYDQHGVAGSGLSGTAHDPYTYALAFQTFSSKMLAVDPTIHLGAVAVSGEDAYGNGSHAVPNPNEGNSPHSGWTPVVLATLKSLGMAPHFLICHGYPQEPGAESDPILLQASSGIATTAANLRKMIADYVGGAPGDNVELAMTEYNSVSSNPGKQSTSLVNGLFLADAIGRLAGTGFNACLWWNFRDGSETWNNNRASLYGWRAFGDYGLVASGDRGDTPSNTPYPSFYAAELLARWGRGGDRVVGAASSYPLLSTYAAKLSNGNIALLFVNKHPSADITAQITLSGFTAGTNAGLFYSYGKPNDTSLTGLTSGIFSNAAQTFSHTFPAYSMTVLVVKGQYQGWREQQFTADDLGDPGVSGDAADPDGDGIPNLMEYALGLEAKTCSVAGLPVAGTQTDGGRTYLTLTFAKIRSLADITYTVQVSGDLQTWNSGPSYAARTDDGSTDQAVYRDLTAIQDHPRRFIRLMVTRP
ncbi:MAG: alpha-L-arabinofuranosidase [Verrucomicrobia bacterium]|nr:alpha-L-arabinofuranosidase [Verrucomicrobiota bacterium]